MEPPLDKHRYPFLRKVNTYGHYLLYKNPKPTKEAREMDYRELAAKAADELERRDWIQFHSADGQDLDKCAVCAEGAIMYVLTRNPNEALFRLYDRDLYTFLDLEASISQRTGFVSIPAFNDAPSTTKDKVVGVLRTIARS